MKTQKTKMVSPQDARREKDLISLRTCISRKPISFHVYSGEVSIHQGEGASFRYVDIPRRTFEELIKFYQTPQRIK